ncbi:MAG: HPr family phosphocarrier protein [Eubacteriales bacterium]|nr:HPr family phosphocarrier protein [Eubacteriales bacterium]
MIEIPIDFDELLPFNRITALKIVDVADNFKAQCLVRSQRGEINIKSILGVMSLKPDNGNHLFISGIDEREASEALLALFNNLKNA